MSMMVALCNLQSGGKESMLSKCKRFVTRSHNLTLLILWALFLALVVYAQVLFCLYTDAAGDCVGVCVCV
jgi:hypothetical protein